MIVYGKHSYTDEKDPRQVNARSHSDNNGKITGVHLQVHVLNGAPYECTNVYVVDEDSAKGGHTAYVYIRNSEGQLIHEKCALLTGYNGDIIKFDDILLPGNDKMPIEHPITNKFFPPDLGPLAISIMDQDNLVIISDVVASLGLPGGHHVSFVVEFQQRSEVSKPDPKPPIPQTPIPSSGILEEMHSDIKDIKRVLGI